VILAETAYHFLLADLIADNQAGSSSGSGGAPREFWRAFSMRIRFDRAGWCETSSFDISQARLVLRRSSGKWTHKAMSARGRTKSVGAASQSAASQPTTQDGAELPKGRRTKSQSKPAKALAADGEAAAATPASVSGSAPLVATPQATSASVSSAVAPIASMLSSCYVRSLLTCYTCRHTTG
jgi:hypothetical protein